MQNEYKNGPWTVHSTQIGFENSWVRVEASNITHPDGSPGTYGVVRYAHLACGVLPFKRYVFRLSSGLRPQLCSSDSLHDSPSTRRMDDLASSVI